MFTSAKLAFFFHLKRKEYPVYQQRHLLLTSPHFDKKVFFNKKGTITSVEVVLHVTQEVT